MFFYNLTAGKPGWLPLYIDGVKGTNCGGGGRLLTPLTTGQFPENVTFDMSVTHTC